MLEFLQIQASSVEVYVNGELAFEKTAERMPRMSAEFPIELTTGKRADIRALLHADNTRGDCGIAMAIRLYRAEE